MAHDAPATGTSADSSAPSPDRRRVRRRRVLKEGKLVFGHNQSVADCVIDNDSPAGAHVRITSNHGVPHDFYLVEASRRIIHKAEVAWRTPAGMGLKLLGPVEDDATRESLLRRFLRR